MFYFFFFFITDAILKFVTELFKKTDPNFKIDTWVAAVLHIFIGLLLISLALLILYLLFHLIKLWWDKKLRNSKFGKYLERELLPVTKRLEISTFWKHRKITSKITVDWWIGILIFFCSEIIIEYWQIFRSMSQRSELIDALTKIFFPGGTPAGYEVRDFVSMVSYYGMSIIFYMLLPLLLLFIKGIKTRDHSYVKYTFTFGKWKPGLLLIGTFWVVMLIVLYFAMGFSPELRGLYPLLNKSLVENDIKLFLIYEFVAMFYLIAFEYFFRGILYFEFEKKIGNYALVITILPYIIHKFGKPTIEIVAAIIAGLALSLMSKWTRTFLYGALLHFVVAFSADIMALLYQKGIIVFPFLPK